MLVACRPYDIFEAIPDVLLPIQKPSCIPQVRSAEFGQFRQNSVHLVLYSVSGSGVYVNGVPQAFEADGQTARMGKDGPMTLAEWVDALVSDAPHLFEANAGGGAAGSGSGGAGNRSVKNPFRKDSWNLTEQMKLQKSDPQLAARLKASA